MIESEDSPGRVVAISSAIPMKIAPWSTTPRGFFFLVGPTDGHVQGIAGSKPKILANSKRQITANRQEPKVLRARLGRVLSGLNYLVRILELDPLALVLAPQMFGAVRWLLATYNGHVSAPGRMAETLAGHIQWIQDALVHPVASVPGDLIICFDHAPPIDAVLHIAARRVVSNDSSGLEPIGQSLYPKASFANNAS